MHLWLVVIHQIWGWCPLALVCWKFISWILTMLSNMPLPRTLSYQQNLPLRGDGYMNPELFPDNQLGIYSEFPATPSPPNSGSKASWLVFFPIIQVPIAIIQSSLNPATSEGNGCHGAATWNSWACCILPACRLVCCFTQCIWWLMQVFFCIDQIPNYIKKIKRRFLWIGLRLKQLAQFNDVGETWV